MTAPTDTIGAQLRQPDPRGWLVFDHLPPTLQNAEDSTLDADVTRHRDHWHARGPVFRRNATPAERALLAHLGYELPERLTTRVEFLTDHLRHRSWPALHGQTPNPQHTQEDQP